MNIRRQPNASMNAVSTRRGKGGPRGGVDDAGGATAKKLGAGPERQPEDRVFLGPNRSINAPTGSCEKAQAQSHADFPPACFTKFPHMLANRRPARILRGHSRGKTNR
jgi:hypothetical protein